MIRTYTLTTADEDQWRRVVPSSLSAQASVEYVRICEEETGWPARMFVMEEDRPLAAHVYLMRSNESLPFGDFQGADICTPEYRGPLWLNGGLQPDLFKALFEDHCRAEGFVAEFAHLNPWSAPHELLEAQGLRGGRQVVYVDLTLREEEIWMHSLCSDARRQTKQGQRAGVQVRRADSAQDIWTFYQLYTKTMDRHRAHQRYYYSFEYFLGFFETMRDAAFFTLAEYEGQLVAGGLYFMDATDVYWHLSAADRKFTFLRPVNVYLYETIRQLLGGKRRRMLLGGGYGPNDGVFRFKAQFSPLREEFYTYRRIHNRQTYDALSNAWRRYYNVSEPPDFFPVYRGERREIAQR